ncbi:2'-5' RNA ligase family protein [Hymenobacter terrenus]|uniref:2'-5' RNA ligase family protein n=1 Tax=Hymenobacter terrenus TaxID=1629124 RepID=UPI00061995C1|nr:mutarotase [Hymenobacter terrenus]
MNLQAHYDTLREDALRQLAQGEADLDLLIDSSEDNRRGITLLTRPPAPITAIIKAITADFQSADPTQYYYPATDIHLTILSIISCYSGFTLDMIAPSAYQEVVRAIVEHVRPFTITYSGLTASPSGIMVQGVPEDDSLENLREQTRKFFRQSGLQHSIDQRYTIQTAHSTVIRFKNPIQDPHILVEIIRKYQQFFIGSFEVNTVELVYNDWYQRARNTVLLEEYSLGR